MLSPDEVREFIGRQLQAFDIDHDHFDHADIRELSRHHDDDEHDFYLTLYHAENYPNGVTHLNEAETWTVDEDLRQLVLERSLVPEDQLRMAPLPTVTGYLGDTDGRGPGL